MMDAEVTHLVIEVLLAIVGAFLLGLGWLLRTSFQRLGRIELSSHHYETRIEVLENASVTATVQDHEVRLRTLEGSLASIRAGMDVLVVEIKAVKSLLEAQVTSEIKTMRALIDELAPSRRGRKQ